MLHFIVQPLIILVLIGIDFVIILEMYYKFGYLIWVILLPEEFYEWVDVAIDLYNYPFLEV